MVMFAAKCPVEDRVRGWIDENTGWLRQEFGDAPLTAPVIVPSEEFFPPPFGGTDGEVRDLVARIARYMSARNDISVEFKDDLNRFGGESGHEAGRHAVPGRPSGPGTPAGPVILRLERSAVSDQARLIAVIAHAIGRARLVGERRAESSREDIDQLAELATVYLGMGIFTARTSRDFRPPGGGEGRANERRPWRRGYLTGQMFGYALGRWTLLRDDPDPSWAAYLGTGTRKSMRDTIRYLRQGT